MSAWGGRGRGGFNGHGGVTSVWGNPNGRGRGNGNGPTNENNNMAPPTTVAAAAASPSLAATTNDCVPIGTANAWSRPRNGNGSANANPNAEANGLIISGVQRLQIRDPVQPLAPTTSSSSAIVSASTAPQMPLQNKSRHDEEGRRASRPPRPTYPQRCDYVPTRANIMHTTTKVGTKGIPVPLVANYFRLKRKPDWTIFHYHVDFLPEQTNTRLKKGLVGDQYAKLGAHVTDGSSLWTSHRLAQPLTLASQTRRGEHVQLQVKLVGEVDDGDPSRLQIFNVILRTCLGPTSAGGLGLVLNRRNYFDPAAARRNVTNSRLTIWPGYVTTMRQFDDDLLLNVGIKHKIIRSETCLDVIRGAQAHEALVGSIVLTQYNNKTYKVADVDFNRTPASTFPLRDGSSQSYMDYYQTKHGVTIRDLKQPLLVAQMKKKDFHRGAGDGGVLETIYLIPELCYRTGITESERGDFRFMRALNEVVMQNPTQKLDSILAFMGRLHNHAGVTATLVGWGLAFDTRPVDVRSRALPTQAVFMAAQPGDSKDAPGALRYRGSDWTMEIVKGRKMDECKSLGRWILLRPSSMHPNLIPKLLRHMKEVAQGLGFAISEPLEVATVAGGRGPNSPPGPGDYQKAIQAKCAHYARPPSRLDLILAVLPNNKPELYAVVKRECCIAAVHSQCVVGRTIDKEDHRLRSVATKIVIQINAKLGGVPWKLEAPFKAPTMVVGFDVYHCGKASGRSVGAMVATRNKPLSKFYSTPTWQERGQELSTKMCADITKCVEAFAKHNNGLLPSSIIFFRDGVGEGQLHYVCNVELQAMKEALRVLYASRGQQKGRPKLTFIVVTKRINARLFKPAGGAYVDAEPGTVVDTVITQPERYDFLLTSVKAPKESTASPTSYNMIHDDNGFHPDEIQEWAYRQCHGYFNWSGTVSVPAVCQYAHKLAYLTGTANLTPETVQALSDTLYYL